MNVVELMALISDEDNPEPLVETLGLLPEKERRALAPPLIERLRHDAATRGVRPRLADLAVLGCVPSARQLSSELGWDNSDPALVPLAVRVLTERGPRWLAALPSAVLSNEWPSAFRWELVRALVRSGVLDRPGDDGYFVHMPLGVSAARYADVRNALEADPSILGDELWTMLSTEGCAASLERADRDRESGGWSDALVSLSSGPNPLVDRHRLIDAVLGVFLRDWRPRGLGWFVGMHDALSLSVDEMASRRNVYLRILAADYGPAVAMAQDAVEGLLGADRIDLGDVAGAAEAVLLRDEKKPVIRQLELLARQGSAQPASAPMLAATVAIALGHPRVDVQEAAMGIMERLVPNAAERSALMQPHTELLAPTVRPGPQPAAVIESSQIGGGVGESSARRQPITDPDQLAALFSRLIEDAADPADVERALGAVARLARKRPTRGAEVLLRRAIELPPIFHAPAWSGDEIRADLCALVRVWLAGETPGQGYRGRPNREFVGGRWIESYRPDHSLKGVIAGRIHEVAQIVADGGGTLLAEPTSPDGEVSVEVLNRRLEALSGTAAPRPHDIATAALRVDPVERRRVVVPRGHRAGRLLLTRLGALDARQPAWVRIVSRQAPGWNTGEAFVTWADSASRPAADDPLVTVLDRSDPVACFGDESSDGDWETRFDQVIAMWPLHLPHHPDLLAAHAHSRVIRALTRTRGGAAPILIAIGRSADPSDPVSQSALALGLCAKHPVDSTPAVDAFVELAERSVGLGRTDDLGAALGAQGAAHLGDDIIIGSRFVRSLEEAARTGSAAGLAALSCLNAMLPALPGRRDAHLFVNLAAQLGVELSRPVELPEPFRALAAGRANSQLARACRRVVNSD